jgi:hypothetical protein
MRTLADVEKMARTALANIPQVFYSSEDPTAKHNVKNGAIWVKPINQETGRPPNPRRIYTKIQHPMNAKIDQIISY